jgi:hypothetical protein
MKHNGTNQVQVSDTDKFTPFAVAMRRQLADRICDGAMPMCLAHLNVGEMKALIEITNQPWFQKVPNARNMGLKELKNAMYVALADYREKLMTRGVEDDYREAVEIRTPVLTWA